MAEVDPDADKDEEVGPDEGVVEVVEDLGGGEEEVADVVGGVDGDAHVGEVEAVAEGDEGEADDVVADELLEVLARLLHAEEQDDGLLGPVGGLEEVVELDGGLVGAVREGLVHAARVEVPDGGARHDEDASRAEEEEVDGRVGLLHEARLLVAPEAGGARPRPQHLLHDELAREGEHDGVEGHKGHVPGALAVVDGLRGVVLRQPVREEDETVQRVGFARVDGVAREEEAEDGQGQHPRVPHARLPHAREQAACTTAFGETLAAAAAAAGAGAIGRCRRRQLAIFRVVVTMVVVEAGLARGKCRGASVARANLAAETAGFSTPSRALDLEAVQLLRGAVEQRKGLRHDCCVFVCGLSFRC